MSSVTRVALPVVAVVLLGAAAFFIFHKSPKPISSTPGQVLALRRSHVIAVPEVRGQTLVSAKGALEQAGLAWAVAGAVKGYHTNVVLTQIPKPGTKLIDTGTPLVTLRLAKSGPQTGSPQNRSSAPGTKDEVVGAPSSGVAAAATSETLSAAAATTTAPPRAVTTTAATTAATTTAPQPTTRAAVTTAPRPTTRAAVTTARAPAAPHVQKPATAPKGTPPLSDRPPAFVLPGGKHRERAGELPLPVRAARLQAFVRAHPKPSNRVVRHWLVQHAWIAAGARFGWWHGAQALATLVATDRLVEARWGIGYRSEGVARAALAFVHAHEVKR
jgi:hypothetical protein